VLYYSDFKGQRADDVANKVSQRPGVHPARERLVNEVFTLPVVTTCKVVTYKRSGFSIIALTHDIIFLILRFK